MKRILVIEDEGPLREALAEILRLEEFEVLDAPEGETGFQIAKEQSPDLILSDIRMPCVDGYTFLKALRADDATASIPVIFLTALDDHDSMRQCMELGADDYLTKPFTRVELVNAVAARLQRQDDLIADRAYRDMEQTKRILFEMVSHELRTPLISMIMVQDIIELQMDHLEPDRLRELLESLHHSSHRLRHLVEQIVYLTQFQSRTIRQEIQENGSPMQLWAVLTGAITLAREYVYRNRDGSIRFDDMDRESLIYCHPAALRHALAELIANALNFTPDGDEIMLSRWVSDDGWAWIRIADPGCGMSPEQIEQALRDFNQIDRRHQEQQGMGLGLPLACRILDMHGGGLELESVVGQGTQVDVRLPVWQAPAS